jgi:hypothetical protein
MFTRELRVSVDMLTRVSSSRTASSTSGAGVVAGIVSS